MNFNTQEIFDKPSPPEGRLVGNKSTFENFMWGVFMCMVAIVILVMIGILAYFCGIGINCVNNHR